MNHSPNASKIFIQIREAYDFLLSYYDDQYINDDEPIENYKAKQQQDIFEEWVRYRREKVRRQAAYEARMKYRNFKKTKAYKTTIVFNKVANVVIFISGILIIFGSIYGLHEKGIYDYSKGYKALDYNGLLATILVSIIGLVIVVFTYLNRKLNN